MKRMALTLAAFALTGALAFADDAAAPVVKISTEVNSGLVYSGNSASGATKPYAIDYNAGGSNFGPVVGVTFNLTGSNFGYSIEPALKGWTSALSTANNLFVLDHAYAWVNPADGAELYAGASGNNAPFGDLDDNGAGNYSTTALGAFYTTNGFSFGAQIQEVAQTSSNNNSYWAGVRYALDKVVTLNAYGSNDYTGTLDQLHITFSLAAVPNLTLTGGFNGSGMSTTSAASNFIDVTGAYAVTSAFTGGVTVYADNLSANTLSASTQAYYVYKPYVTYAISPMFTVLAYYDGETAPISGATVDNQILGQLQYTPVAGTTLKFSVWYDTNIANAGTLNSTYTGAAISSTSSIAATSAAIDAKFTY